MTNAAPKVLIHNDKPGGFADKLREAIPEAEIFTHDSYDGMDEVLKTTQPDVLYSIRFGGTYGFPTEDVLGTYGPEWISVGGSGCDHLGTWDTSETTVTNSAGVASDMMSEFAFGCALHFTLDVPQFQKDKAARRWKYRYMTPLKGKTLLVVGLGHTGQSVAAKAKAFGMHVLGTRARPTQMDNVDEVHPASALPDLWPRADMIVVSVPLLDSTKGLISASDFAAMKDTAILIDVSRGGVIKGDDLLTALHEGQIAAAGLDVFELEPLPEDSPFWDAPNAIISPHSSAIFAGWGMASFEMFIENLKRWQRGEPLHNVVNPERGY
ncbi:MAG: D-2-hydroxyacid dehydrogenase [Pseudomonadota bacterium]